MERKQLDSFLLNKYTILKKYENNSLFNIYEGLNNFGEKIIVKTTKDKFSLNEILKNEFKNLLQLKIKKIPHPIEIINNQILILKYIQGETLYSYRRSHTINWIEVRNIFLQILELLNQLHDQNICHGDIKLENILYDRGNIYLIDFGASSILKDNQEIKQFTPRYNKDITNSYTPIQKDIYCLFRVFLFLIRGDHEVIYNTLSEKLNNFIRKGLNKTYNSTVEVLDIWDYLKI